MKASFYEYNIAMTGLFTAKSNINVISHNIANAAMPGFSRQYALQKAHEPLTLRDGKGMYGLGSNVYGISQIRDIYLDRKYWSQNAYLGEYTVKNTQSELIEIVFNDMPELDQDKGSGIRSAFSDFFMRLQDLTTTTPDATFRTNVISAAETLAKLVQSNAEILQRQQRDINQEMEIVVTRINSLGTQIASLNKQIIQSEYDGSNANDLRDQRALLVDELSEYVNVQVQEYDYSTPSIQNDKRFTVMINGYDFVNHTSVHTLKCVPRDNGYIDDSVTPPVNYNSQKRNVMDVDGLYDIYFADSKSLFNIYSTTLTGTLKGLVDMRDGNNSVTTLEYNPSPTGGPVDPYDVLNGAPHDYTTVDYKGIPFYMNKLNDLVRTFARAINEGLDNKGDPIITSQGQMTGHMYGYDMYGLDTQQQSGLLFFTRVVGSDVYGEGDFTDREPPVTGYRTYKEMTCLNFNVNPALIEDSFKLACASDPSKGESSNDMIIGFAQLNSYERLFREGKLIDFIIATTDHIAIDRMQAKNFEVSYTEITMSTQNQRLSVSGVDLNEEFAAMIKYNQLYQACAKLVNVIDKIYDTMINRLGVG